MFEWWQMQRSALGHRNRRTSGRWGSTCRTSSSPQLCPTAQRTTRRISRPLGSHGHSSDNANATPTKILVPNSGRCGKRCQRGAGHHAEPSGGVYVLEQRRHYVGIVSPSCYLSWRGAADSLEIRLRRHVVAARSHPSCTGLPRECARRARPAPALFLRRRLACPRSASQNPRLGARRTLGVRRQ